MWARGQLKAPPRFAPDQDEIDAHNNSDRTDAALNAFGLVVESDDDAPDAPDTDTPFYLWPENWPLWCLWRNCETQWHTSMDGATGLDYPGVWGLIARCYSNRKKRAEVFWLVQAMEEATLAAWRDMRASNA